MTAREVGGYLVAYCSLCDRVAEDGHLESKPHTEAKQDPAKYMSLQSRVDGFFVNLQLEGENHGLILSEMDGQVTVVGVEPESLMEQWNIWAWKFDVQVEEGCRVLEVDGLRGQDAVKALAVSKRRLGLTVAMPQPETDDGQDSHGAMAASQGWRSGFAALSADDQALHVRSGLVEGLEFWSSQQAPADIAATWATRATHAQEPQWPPVVDIDGHGVLWQARFNGTRAKEAMDLRSSQISMLDAGAVVMQVGACVDLQGLLRMQIFVGADLLAWVTLDARACDGDLFFSPGCAGCLWQAQRKVVVRSGCNLESDVVEEFLGGKLVRQVGPCELTSQTLRMPVSTDQTEGWVTLSAAC